MTRVKVRCARCAKAFTTSNLRQIVCDSCGQAARQERRRSTPAIQPQTPRLPAPAPLVTGPAAYILKSESVFIDHIDDRAAESANQDDATSSAIPTQADSATGEIPPSFELTDVLRERIERRYQELAQPAEFDGIRTQIASEFDTPKWAVRQVVRELRARTGAPSWWELKSFHGSATDLERVKDAYLPYLPVPPIGIHRQIAEALQLHPHTVYRAIRRVRASMRLPQFNPLDTHPEIILSESQPSGED